MSELIGLYAGEEAVVQEQPPVDISESSAGRAGAGRGRRGAVGRADWSSGEEHGWAGAQGVARGAAC